MPRIYLDTDWMAEALWDADDGANLSVEDLPLSAALKADLQRWAESWDHTLYDHVVHEGPAPPPEWEQAHEAEKLRLWRAVRRELGDDYAVGLVSGTPTRSADPGWSIKWSEAEVARSWQPKPGDRLYVAGECVGVLWTEADDALVALETLPLTETTRGACDAWTRAYQEDLGDPEEMRRARREDLERLCRILRSELAGHHEVGFLPPTPTKGSPAEHLQIIWSPDPS